MTGPTRSAPAPIVRRSDHYIGEMTLNGKRNVTIRVLDRATDGSPGHLVLAPTEINLMNPAERTRYLLPLPSDEARVEMGGMLDSFANDLHEYRQIAPASAIEAKPKQGTPVAFPDPDSWPDPVDGAVLLNAIAEILTQQAVPPEGGADAGALFAIFTYVHHQPWVRVSPKLLITAPTKRCGKSKFLTLLAAVVRRPLATTNISPAALYRAVEKYAPTLLVDEADTFLTAEQDELRGLLNGSHTRAGAFVIRTVGEDFEVRTFSTWTPMILAMIRWPPDTIRDRSIPIVMQRKASTEHIVRTREDRLYEACAPIRSQAMRWAEDAESLLAAWEPDVPDQLDDRQQDNWRSLIAIADAAGGDWPERARWAALATSGQHAEDDTPGVQCLADIRDLFEQRGTDRLSSTDITGYLVTLDGRPWSDWRGKPIIPAGLARVLRPFGIKPDSVRIDGKTPKGYHREQFVHAFTHYLLPSQSATAATSLRDNGLDDSQTATRETGVAVSDACKLASANDVAAVAVSHPSPGFAVVAGGARERKRYGT